MKADTRDLNQFIEEAASSFLTTQPYLIGSGLGLLVRPRKPRDFHRSA